MHATPTTANGTSSTIEPMVYATLYLIGTSGDQASLAYTSTSIAFVTFVVILIYHTVAFTCIYKVEVAIPTSPQYE